MPANAIAQLTSSQADDRTNSGQAARNTTTPVGSAERRPALLVLGEPVCGPARVSPIAAANAPLAPLKLGPPPINIALPDCAPIVLGPPGICESSALPPALAVLLGRVREVRRTQRNQWSALCPAHDDHEPSLSITEKAGRVLLHCFGGCAASDVLAAIGLTFADLAPRGGDLQASLQSCARRLNGVVVGLWVYDDAARTPILAVARFETPKGKAYRPFHPTNHRWSVGDPPSPLPLYRLPDLAGHDRVFVVEGEKCADAMWSIGLPATTSAHGAKGAKKTNWSPLIGHDVVILPDNDTAGRKYAQAVAAILGTLNNASKNRSSAWSVQRRRHRRLHRRPERQAAGRDRGGD